jgi:hypothetical protein
MEFVKRCIYQSCNEPSDGWFMLAIGTDEPREWPISIPYLDEPLPLCQWHAQLVGDQRVQLAANRR